ncbi:MAG: DUF4351 domain-containing protein [Chloroflexota bacterium]
MAQANTNYIAHDRLFKEFFRRFLAQFMKLFFEAKAARLDLSNPQFIDQEWILNAPGKILRITDVVAVVPVLESDEEVLHTSIDDNIVRRSNQDDEEEDEPESKEELIILHVDVEANHPKPIPNRMCEYYVLIRILEEKPVLPIALILRGRSYKAGTAPEMDSDSSKMRTYTEQLWGEPLLNFRYYEVVLEDLMSEEYLDKNDPIAAALAVLMKHEKGISALIKKRSLDIIIQDDELSEGDKRCLVKIVQEYLPDEKVQGGTEEIMQQLEEYRLTWWERAEVGALQRMLIKQLRFKFQELPDELIERIQAINMESILDDIAAQILSISSLDDLKLPEPA